jgi:tRNA(adenine34) deaminase
MNNDKKWMALAIKQAVQADTEGEVPVGAVIVKDGQLIAQAHNQPISTNDATAHAEIQLLRAAGKLQKNYRLINTTIYVTLEPCAMCLGAMMHARIARMVFGASDPKTGVCGSRVDLTTESFFNHEMEINGGVLEKECKELLQSFFKSRRKDNLHV